MAAVFRCFLFLIVTILLKLCRSGVTATDANATFSDQEPCIGKSCAYDAFACNIKGEDVAAVPPGLFKSGSGCGACYQIKCKDPTVCSKDGIKIVATNSGQGSGNDVHFILSLHTASSLALPNMAKTLIERGNVDIEYYRVSCYFGRNMMIHVKNESNVYYIAIVFLFKGGQQDIVRVQIAQAKCNCHQWREMENKNGFWDLQNPPKAPWNMRLFTEDNRCVLLKRNVIPACWKPGERYDTGITEL